MTQSASKIIVFTDTHMATNPRKGRPEPNARLAAGLKHVSTFNADADCIIFCGDLTHEGDALSYELLQSRLQDTALPVHLMLGNHDNRETFRYVFPDAPVDENGFIQQVIDLPDMRLVLLDTLFGPPYQYPESHAGYLCEARLAWLDRQLTQAADKPCCIFMHHPPHDTGFPAMDQIKLRNGEEFYACIARHSNVKHLICGHIHRTISGTHNGLPFSVFKSTVGQMPMQFTSLDSTVENDEPAAYGIVFFTPGGILVHTEDYEISGLEAG